VRRLELDASGTEKLPICGLSIWRVGTWPVPFPWVLLIPPMVTLKSPGPAAPVETEPARPARRIEAIRALLMAVLQVYEWNDPAPVVQCLCQQTQVRLVHHMEDAPKPSRADLSRCPTPSPHPVMNTG
jgi:hypothetical protein